MIDAEWDAILSALPSLMHGFPAPWCVAGGWAIDLFLNRVTRPHQDVELAIFRQDQASLHKQFLNWTFRKVKSSQFFPWPVEEYLQLPIHEIHATTENPKQQMLEFLLNERIREEWVFRRDEEIRLPLHRAILNSQRSLPILNPAIALLYKAKSPRPKDEMDFNQANRALANEDRDWLREALQQCHPGHAWTDPLASNV